MNKKKYGKIIYSLFLLSILLVMLLNERHNFKNLSHQEKVEMNFPISKQTINEYISFIPDNLRNKELNYIQTYKLLQYNCSKIDLIRQLLNSISFNQQKGISKVDCLILKNKFRFGNLIIALNNAIFYCEILECKKIILLEGYGLIKNVVKYIYHNNKTMEINSVIYPGNNSFSNLERGICIEFDISFFYFPKLVFPQIRTDSIKEEIVRNLPNVEIKIDDIFIFIRSGDVFSGHVPNDYTQPPLCFYEKIIQDFKFRNYYIISENKNNPIIDELLNRFHFIKYKKNSIKIDLSTICHAYNLVGGVSSFVISSIKFNDNLKYFWQYNIYRLTEKLFHLHHDIYNYKIKYNIYTMEPSLIYKKEMFDWRNTDYQRNLMLNDTCPFYFTLRKADVDFRNINLEKK